MDSESFPKISSTSKLCNALQLCCIRKNWDDQNLIAIRHLDWSTEEQLADDIIALDEFEWKSIRRVYSSWHVFLNETWDEVYLIEVEKNGVHHFQFTGWSPKEEIYKQAYYMDDWKLKLDLWVVEANAKFRTKSRTWVEVIDVRNEIPTIDWVLIEKQDPSWERYWSLVCLMHYLVKEYKWKLSPQVWVESVVAWDRISLSTLTIGDGIAPNVDIITKYLKKEYFS